MKNVKNTSSKENRYTTVFFYPGQLPQREVDPKIPEIEEPVKEDINPERHFPEREVNYPDEKEINEENPDREWEDPKKEEAIPKDYN